ncbi:response regulator transcription factor [soil metagenome]
MERILVIDDDRAVTDALQRGLGLEGFAVDAANSGEDGLRLCRDNDPNLIILDVMMPGMDGLDVLRRIRQADSRLPILMLTARDAPGDEALGLQYGADDYVVKPFNWDVLIARVKALMRRSHFQPDAVLRLADLSLSEATRMAARGDREISLTPTEYDLLREFLLHSNRVLPRDFLMERVWGYEPVGGTNVLETYVKQLRQKLEASDEPRLIHTVHGVGYILREP